MKPTISSQNKANGGTSSSSGGVAAIRSSTGNLRRRGMQSSGKTENDKLISNAD